MRAIYPAARILLSKFDFKSAYRRVHFRAELALQSCITTKGLGGLDLALVSLRTTFGGSPCPSIFSEISETVTRSHERHHPLFRLRPSFFSEPLQSLTWPGQGGTRQCTTRRGLLLND